MWEDAMNKMFNPFNFFREWRMMCLSLCYNTFIRTFSPWIRWASYHFYSDVFPYDTMSVPHLYHEYIITFRRTSSHSLRWASYHISSIVIPLLRWAYITKTFIPTWFLWYNELLSTFISILICRSVPMPVELFCPIAPYSTFSRWPTW